MTPQEKLDRALAFHAQGQLDKAEKLYAGIMASQRQNLFARHMLGVVRAQQGRHEEALVLISAVVEAAPNDALALANRGNVLNELGRCQEALESFDRSLALNMRSAEAWNGRAEALRRTADRDAALESLDRALALHPGLAPALIQRANLLHAMTRYGEAVSAYNRALAVMPDNPDLLNNRGLSLQLLGRFDEARDSFQRAIARDPQMAEAQVNMALWYMLQQDFARGLPLFEWRKKVAQPMEARVYPQPLWTGGEDLTGKTLFVYTEQGLGDTIQFYRYVAPVLARGAKVILSVPNPMLALLRDAVPAVELIGWMQTPPAFDFHIPLASLMLALQAFEIAPTAPYITAQPQRRRDWGARLGSHGFRIGVVWQCNTSIPGSEGRSYPLAALAGIAALPGVRLINLQKNAGAEQLAQLPPGMTVECFDFDEGPGAFLDTAAIMMNLDLVISADSAPVHLAGALGVPCWVPQRKVPDWRWFLNRPDCPWYASVRLFRQSRGGDWTGPLHAMEAELAARLGR